MKSEDIPGNLLMIKLIIRRKRKTLTGITDGTFSKYMWLHEKQVSEG